MENTIILPKHIIDPHCHGRDLKQAYKTTVKQALAEAKQGFISISAFMPNTDEPLITLEAEKKYNRIMQIACNKLLLPKQLIWFGATDYNLSECQIALRQPEIIGLKVYPLKEDGSSVTTGKIGVMKDSTILQAMQIACGAKKAIAFHCDDPEIALAENYSIRAEAEYVKKIIRIGKKVPGVKIAICHVSCKKSAELIIEARHQGMDILIEVTPHHLWFSSDGDNWNPALNPVFYHCYNKLRTKEDREFLRWLIKSENMDFVYIGSDNAPHTWEEKLVLGLGGIPSNQEMVAVICTLALEYGIPEKRVLSLLAFNAAKFFGINIPFTYSMYKLVRRPVIAKYNGGIVENPWAGSELYFPEPY